MTNIKRPTLQEMAEMEPWFVVQNGNQADIHARVYPSNESAREITVRSDLEAEEAAEVVKVHNISLKEHNDFLNEAESLRWL